MLLDHRAHVLSWHTLPSVHQAAQFGTGLLEDLADPGFAYAQTPANILELQPFEVVKLYNFPKPGGELLYIRPQGLGRFAFAANVKGALVFGWNLVQLIGRIRTSVVQARDRLLPALQSLPGLLVLGQSHTNRLSDLFAGWLLAARCSQTE